MTEAKPHFIHRGHSLRNQTMVDRMGPMYSTAKLTDDQVVEIRRHYATGGVSQYDLAREYNVTRPNISYIVNRKSWKAVA